MKFTLINIANKMPKWVDEACNEFLLRINHGAYKCNIVAIKGLKAHQSKELQMEAEAHKLQAQVVALSYLIILDENGLDLSSFELAKHIGKLKHNYSHISLIIGGANGISPALKAQANMTLRLSSLTFSHSLARVVVLEQLYRVISILEGHPYHRE